MSRILIVEDNEKNLKLLRDVLAHQGHEVLAAVTGGEGRDLALNERPDLVLLDIQLPDIDGITVLRCLREEPALDAMPVLAISASVMPEEQHRITQSGFDAFVAKPISLKPFLATVNHFLQHGRGKGPP
ncbi:response regulator [Aquincola sp. S2]|uniref:Response regulator n=1 Tax=Pseudaquabacterium terrae TaxID=2732868 RepID=A0ABX2ELB8_9BURK|nr:response regulator [Aquabacterium terrae]NRF69356.1 response regulator [Aquabacterium terrae]